MSEESREKYWQEKAGRMASIANWALNELLENVDVLSGEHDLANEYLEEVSPFLVVDESDG